MAPRRSLKTRISNFSSHSAASDDGKGVSNLWLRGYSSDKESIWQSFYPLPLLVVLAPFILFIVLFPYGNLRPPEPAASDNRLVFPLDESAAPYARSIQTEKEAAHSSPTVASRGRRITDQRERMLHLPLCFEVSTTRLDTEPLDFSSGSPEDHCAATALYKCSIFLC
jgi:hypothetical protein